MNVDQEKEMRAASTKFFSILKFFGVSVVLIISSCRPISEDFESKMDNELFEKMDLIHAKAIQPSSKIHEKRLRLQAEHPHLKTVDSLLTHEEQAFEMLWYFYSAGLAGAGDPFGYLPCIIDYADVVKAMGADGCYQALSELRAEIDEYGQIEGSEERHEYWTQATVARERAVELVEDFLVFGIKLVEWAENHPKIGNPG